MAWQFELVAGPFEGPTGGVVWDGARGKVLFSTVDEGRLLWFDHVSKAVTEFRRYANRVNGLAFGPNGEGFLRLAYSTSDDLLQSAVERMGNVLAERVAAAR